MGNCSHCSSTPHMCCSNRSNVDNMVKPGDMRRVWVEGGVVTQEWEYITANSFTSRAQYSHNDATSNSKP